MGRDRLLGMQLRTDVNAVHVAHGETHEQLQEAARRNEVAAAVGRLCDALTSGGPSESEISTTRGAAPDELVATVLRSVPAGHGSVSTVEELQQRWPAIRRSIRVDQALSQVPQTGFLSTCLAVVSSALKVWQRSAVSACRHGSEWTL
jgi:hypothetical protein